MTAVPASPVLTLREAGAYLKRGRTWMLKHADLIGCIRDGGRIAFRQERLDTWLTRHETEPKSKGGRKPAALPKRAPLTLLMDPRAISPLDGKPFGEVAR